MNKIEKIKLDVCGYFNIRFEQLLVKNQNFEIRYPRQMLAYFLMKETLRGSSYIGRMLNQDHTTIIHSVKVIEDLLFADEMVQTDVKAIKELIAQTKSEVSPYCIPGIHGHLNLIKKYA